MTVYASSTGTGHTVSHPTIPEGLRAGGDIIWNNLPWLHYELSSFQFPQKRKKGLTHTLSGGDMRSNTLAHPGPC